MSVGSVNEKPLVSIIIPTYNCRKWVTEAIDSALGQTYPNCEIIVVDDGSDDGTGALLQERYGERITYIFQNNSGRGAARNRGLAEARGTYIQFLDADDLIMPEKIARQVEFLEVNQDVDVVYGDVLLFYEDDIDIRCENEKRKYYSSGDNLLEKMLHQPFLLTVHALHRASCVEAVGGFDVSIRRIEDWDFHLRLARAGAKFHYLQDGGGSLYRQRHTTAPEERIQAAMDSIRMVDKLWESMDSREAKRMRIRKAKAMARFTCGLELLRAGRKMNGLWQLFLSMGSIDDKTIVRAAYLFMHSFLPPRYADAAVDKLVRLKQVFNKR